jgi:hypothetical protein
MAKKTKSPKFVITKIEDLGTIKVTEESCHASRLEAIKTKVYDNILTSNQYNSVLDLMREFTYQPVYQPLTSLDVRLQRIEESFKVVN